MDNDTNNTPVDESVTTATPTNGEEATTTATPEQGQDEAVSTATAGEETEETPAE